MAEDPSYRDFLFELESADHLAYYSAIGRVCVVWSMLEFQFDFNLWLLYETAGGKELASGGPPRSMKNKIAFWNDCYKQLPPLLPQKEHALALSARLAQASRHRNRVLHTNWGNLLAQQRFENIQGSGFKSEKEGFSRYTESIDLNWLHDLVEEIESLQSLLMTFTLATVQSAPRSADK